MAKDTPRASLPDLDLLASFAVFAEQLNFTRAAKALHLSQPAVHLQVRRLSASLGATLYVRRGRALELTDEGRRVAGFAREVTQRAAEFVAELRGERAPEPVVLCAGEGAYLYLLGGAIQRFRAASDAPLRLLTRNREGTLLAVETGEAHLGVTTLDDPPPGLVAEALVEVAQVVVVPAAHALARRRTVKLADLAGARLIVPPAGRPHRAMLAQALRTASVPWEVAVEAGGWELMLRFVALGLGLAVVNDCCAIPEGLVARPLRELPRTTYYVLSRRGAPEAGARGALRRALLQRARASRVSA